MATIIVQILGILIVFLGLAVMIKPATLRQMLEYLKKGDNINKAGIMRLVIGILFLLTASRCSAPLPIAILGVLSIIGGVFVFAS